MKSKNNTPFKMAGFGKKQKSEVNAHNDHAARTNEYKDVISKHGSINKAPSKATQFIRKVKNTPAGTPGAIGFAKKIAKFGLALSPLGVFGKAKAVKNVGSAFGNAAKQYLGKGKSVGKEYRVGGKLYGHYTKSGKLTNKNVPVVGKPGTTAKVPAGSKTKSVSYANPRISMTKAQREAAGY